MELSRLHVTNKELFYAAMMLKLAKLVDVEYLFPADKALLARELDEAKQSLRKKKLLKENSKGEVSLDIALTACAALCADPESCSTMESGRYRATTYSSASAHMLLERGGEGELDAVWFKDKEDLDGYLAGKMDETKMEGKDDGETGGQQHH